MITGGILLIAVLGLIYFIYGKGNISKGIKFVKENPKFGDWSEYIELFDPFRDGLAAHRMGTYLNWILDGFKNNKSRENILEDAANRYKDLWGEDKITTIK